MPEALAYATSDLILPRLQVKEALREAQPLSKWRTVIAYQNACLNASHELDDEHEVTLL